MKKIMLFLLVILLLPSCAKEKTFTRNDGSKFIAKHYGWFEDKSIEGVKYKINVPNMVLNCLFIETIICPVILSGTELWEPSTYEEQKINTTTNNK